MWMTILSIVGPLVGKALGTLAERALKSWKSSAAGGGAAGATYLLVSGLLESAGCPIDSMQLGAAVASIPSLVVGVASMDKSRLLELAKVTKEDGTEVVTSVDAKQVDKDGNPIPRS